MHVFMIVVSFHFVLFIRHTIKTVKILYDIKLVRGLDSQAKCIEQTTNRSAEKINLVENTKQYTMHFKSANLYFKCILVGEQICVPHKGRTLISLSQ